MQGSRSPSDRGRVAHGCSSSADTRTRVCSPTLGRFLQTDPIGYTAGLNWYAYVGNDPLNRSDPTGQACIGKCPDYGSEVVIGIGATGLYVNQYAKETIQGVIAVASMFIPGGQEKGVAEIGAAAKGEGALAPLVRAAQKAGWHVGDDVYASTAKGNAPAWSTVRARFWKNEAAGEGAAEKYGAENINRMSSGRAPQRYNPDKGGTESMELSHEPVPARDGGRDFVPRWPQDHAATDPFRRPGY